MNIDHRQDKLIALTEEELQILQQWAAAPAPGEHKTAALEIPQMMSPRRRYTTRSYMYQAAAALLLFAAGYVMGTLRSSGTTPSAPPRYAAASPPATEHLTLPALTASSATSPAPADPVLSTTVAPTPAHRPAIRAACQSPQIYQTQ